MAVEVRLKRWGNSMGVILPKEFIQKKRIKENEKIMIEVVKTADLSHIFGMIKKRKMSGQDAKNLAREGWGK